MKMENKSIGTIIAVAVILLLGIVFVQIIASNTIDKTQLAGISSEAISLASARLAGNNINQSVTFTLAQAPTGWKLEGTDCDIAGFSLTDASGTSLSGNYTFTTNTG